MDEEQARKIAASDMAFKLHVVTATARLETKMDAVCDRTEKLEDETTAQGKAIAALQVKAGVWGFLSGLVAGLAGAVGIKISGA